MDDQYTLGIAKIDAQHDAISKAVDEIRKSISQKEEQHRVQQALKRLQQTLVTHFNHEEALMEMINYAELSQHKRTHKGVLALFKEYFDHPLAPSDYEYYGQQLIDKVLEHVMVHDLWMTDSVRHHLRAKRPDA